MRTLKWIVASSLLLLSFNAQATKCGDFVYNKHGKLRKYEYLNNNITENSDKHGSSTTHGITTESSTASVDPGVTTGNVIGMAQSVSSWGECAWTNMFALRNDYIEQNMDDIKKQVAQGQGGHMESLAELSGCSPAAAHSLGVALQKETATIYDLESSQSDVLAEQIDKTIRTNSDVAKHCQVVAAR